MTKSRTLAILSPSANHNPICHWYSISEPWPQLTTEGYIFKVEKYTKRLRTEVCLSDQTLIFLVTWTNKNQPYLHRDNRSRTALRGRMRGWERLFSEWQAVTDFNHITVIYCWYIFIGNKFYLFINVRTITVKNVLEVISCWLFMYYFSLVTDYLQNLAICGYGVTQFVQLIGNIL